MDVKNLIFLPITGTDAPDPEYVAASVGELENEGWSVIYRDRVQAGSVSIVFGKTA